MKQWFAQFLNWMQTNSIGLDELNAKNNHGVWYDAQDLAIAYLLTVTNWPIKLFYEPQIDWTNK